MRFRDFLNENTSSQFFTNRKDIEDWMKANSVRGRINRDLTISCSSSVDLSSRDFDYLPVQFDVVKGSFYLQNGEIKSLAGCPNTVTETFEVTNCNNLTSLEGGPDFVGRYYRAGLCDNLTTIKGAALTVKSGYFSVDQCPKLDLGTIVYLPTTLNDRLYADDRLETAPVLHLLTINGLREVFTGGLIDTIGPILNKHLQKPYGNKRIIECQSELIDNGFEQCARLED
jgi:hypothetical protein